ncbi:MAG: DNA-processing protein DprA [Saprospiraceae bacterium]|nr:DNA-processing protein DprA [Saprospiraceae bacterium]
MSKDLLFQIALTQISGIGPRTAKKLISYCGGVEAVFQASRKSLLSIPSLGRHVADLIQSAKNFDPAKRELEFIKKHQISTHFFLDKSYPQRLKQYEDSPILLYFKGNGNLNPGRTIGIIGTRKASPYGLAKCAELVADLVVYQPTIVSGLAYGIDIQAHRAALREKCPTIAVLGHGLDRIYPFQHKKSALEMMEDGGLLSEFPSNTIPDRENFPMRNRIVAAFCDALIVIESAQTGGSLITAEFANQYHKDVFALPGRTTDPTSSGCNFLIKTHQAALLEKATDVGYVLGWDNKPPIPVQTSMFEDLNEEERLVIDLLRSNEVMDFDQLAFQLQLPPSSLSTLVLQLEFKGIIKSAPGNRLLLL